MRRRRLARAALGFTGRLLLGLTGVFGGCTDERGSAALPKSEIDDTDAAPSVARGAYLVEHVVRCPACHSPHDATGDALFGRFLAGVPCATDASPPSTNGVGCLPAPNLTNHATGLRDWTDTEIETALRTGRARDGRQLATQMPYYLLNVMGPVDMQSVIAFLRTVPGVDHPMAPREPPYDAPRAPSQLLTAEDFPAPVEAETSALVKGRYLATLACVSCHTPFPPSGTTSGPALDLLQAFSGGRLFRTGEKTALESANLRPDPTGLAGWRVEDVVRALSQGLDKSGARICGPMPVGPRGTFAGLDREDMAAVGAYLLSLPPLARRVSRVCPTP